MLELFQIWIETARPEITPRHETRKINISENDISLVVSGDKKDGCLFINQDAKIYLGKYNLNEKIKYDLKSGRGIFVFVISGDLEVEGNKLHSRDSLEIKEVSRIKIQTSKDSYFMIIDVPL